jgi:hypothetical protein
MGTMVKIAMLVFLLVKHAYQALNALNVMKMEKCFLKIINVTLAFLLVKPVIIQAVLNVLMHTIQMCKIV